MIRSTFPVRRPVAKSSSPGDIMATLQEVLRIAPQILSAHAEMKALHGEIMTKISSIKQGPPGPAGMGRPGRDGKDADHKAIADIVLSKMRPPRDGRPGKDISPQEVAQFIIDKKLLKPEHIEGFGSTIESLTKEISGMKYGKDTWARGGGDTVSAGSGITITTDTNGKKVIASSGGTNVFGEDLSAQAPGTTFTLAHTPTSGSLRLFRGGARQRIGALNDYTLSGTTITFNTSVASGEIILADYTY